MKIKSAREPTITKIIECFKPDIILPSDNLPITKPEKNPCNIIRILKTSA